MNGAVFELKMKHFSKSFPDMTKKLWPYCIGIHINVNIFFLQTINNQYYAFLDVIIYMTAFWYAYKNGRNDFMSGWLLIVLLFCLVFFCYFVLSWLSY